MLRLEWNLDPGVSQSVAGSLTLPVGGSLAQPVGWDLRPPLVRGPSTFVAARFIALVSPAFINLIWKCIHPVAAAAAPLF